MSEHVHAATPGRIWRGALLVWAGLGVFLTITAVGAFVPLGPFQSAFALTIAAIKVGLVAVFYMELDRSSALVRLAAAAGAIWLTIMFALTLTDFLARSG